MKRSQHNSMRDGAVWKLATVVRWRSVVRIHVPHPLAPRDRPTGAEVILTKGGMG